MSLPTDDKARKALPILTYLTEYFPDATLAEVAVSVAGNEQHNPGQPLHWAREKSKDQLNTAFRHLWDHKMGTHKDIDGQYHLAKAIWRLKAELQLLIEADRKRESVRAAIADQRPEWVHTNDCGGGIYKWTGIDQQPEWAHANDCPTWQSGPCNCRNQKWTDIE
jgi:hypothetical protein